MLSAGRSYETLRSPETIASEPPNAESRREGSAETILSNSAAKYPAAFPPPRKRVPTEEEEAEGGGAAMVEEEEEARGEEEWVDGAEKEKEGFERALFDAIAVVVRLLALLAGRESVFCALFRVTETTTRLAGAARVEAEEKNTGLSRDSARMQSRNEAKWWVGCDGKGTRGARAGKKRKKNSLLPPSLLLPPTKT